MEASKGVISGQEAEGLELAFLVATKRKHLIRLAHGGLAQAVELYGVLVYDLADRPCLAKKRHNIALVFTVLVTACYQQLLIVKLTQKRSISGRETINTEPTPLALIGDYIELFDSVKLVVVCSDAPNDEKLALYLAGTVRSPSLVQGRHVPLELMIVQLEAIDGSFAPLAIVAANDIQPFPKVVRHRAEIALLVELRQFIPNESLATL
mmetsp:Transcript_2523/g.3502  ORF Transcript_2523/g.3502 Transcript_2523/m.3502 type:complete len:209 (-) Transcript_2523:854-1480(-)